MIDIESQLISKILLEEKLQPVLDAKIRPEFFDKDAHVRVFTFILDYYGRYGETPGRVAVKRNFPTYKLATVCAESFEYYIDELLEDWKFRCTSEMLAEAAQWVRDERDADAALEVIQKGLSGISADTSRTTDDNLADPEFLQRWLAEYEELEALEPGTLLGIPTGFPTIDRASSGLQKEQLVLMVGLPAAGKSTGALLMAKAAHEQGHVPMFVGFEMSNKEQQTRYAAIKANIDHHRLFTGRLSVEEKKRFKKLLHQLEDQPDFHMVADPSATSTISGIMSKIEAYTPAVVIIDGVYLMIDEQSGEQNTSKALTNITRSLKRMAQRYKIPIVGTTQVLPWKVSKKTGITADSIGYTSSFAQDADVILGLESTDEGDDIKLLKIVKARNMRLRKTKLEWSWETGVFEERGYEEDYEDEDGD